MADERYKDWQISQDKLQFDGETRPCWMVQHRNSLPHEDWVVCTTYAEARELKKDGGADYMIIEGTVTLGKAK